VRRTRARSWLMSLLVVVSVMTRNNSRDSGMT
jgi:hypothetical protein